MLFSENKGDKVHSVFRDNEMRISRTCLRHASFISFYFVILEVTTQLFTIHCKSKPLPKILCKASSFSNILEITSNEYCCCFIIVSWLCSADVDKTSVWLIKSQLPYPKTPNAYVLGFSTIWCKLRCIYMSTGIIYILLRQEQKIDFQSTPSGK